LACRFSWNLKPALNVDNPTVLPDGSHLGQLYPDRLKPLLDAGFGFHDTNQKNIKLVKSGEVINKSGKLWGRVGI
jgi:hypothetical protein